LRQSFSSCIYCMLFRFQSKLLFWHRFFIFHTCSHLIYIRASVLVIFLVKAHVTQHLILRYNDIDTFWYNYINEVIYYHSQNEMFPFLDITVIFLQFAYRLIIDAFSLNTFWDPTKYFLQNYENEFWYKYCASKLFVWIWLNIDEKKSAVFFNICCQSYKTVFLC